MLTRQVLGLHVDETPFGDSRLSARRVSDVHYAPIEPASQVELLAEGQDVDLAQAEPVFIVNSETQRQPIWEVHQVLVLDGAPLKYRCQAIVSACQISAWIVDVIGARFRCRPASHEVSVAQRKESLAASFNFRVKTVTGENPRIYRRCCGRESLRAGSRYERIKTMHIRLRTAPRCASR